MGQLGGGPSRLSQLDAIRGIAALMVVFNHYIQVVPESIRGLAAFSGGPLNLEAWATPWPWLRFTPLRLLVDGHAAVVVFFLLSGFVLTLPVTGIQQPKFLPFIVKRICRIFIPFALVILCITFVYSFLPLKENYELSTWFNSHIPDWTKVSITDHLLMNGKDIELDPVMWSLVHELRVSFMFPLFFLFLRYGKGASLLVFSILLSLACSFNVSSSDNGTSWQATGHFFWLFATGAVLAYSREKVVCYLSGVSSIVSVALWIGALLLLAIPFDRNWCDFLVGLGAVLIVMLALVPGRGASLLKTIIPVWLGRISYSLYLVHWPIFFLALSYGFVPLWGAFFLTLLASECCYRIIESPAHRIGVHLERRLFRRQSVAGGYRAS